MEIIKGMKLKTFIESFDWTNIYFVIDRVKWISVYDDGHICDMDYETIYDETSESENKKIEDFYDMVIKYIIPIPNNDNDIVILNLLECMDKYAEMAKNCKDGVWERYENAFDWGEDE